MQHTEEIRGYEGNLTGLTKQIVSLTPSTLREFYKTLGYQFEIDSIMDRKGGRPNLANTLLDLSRQVRLISDRYQSCKTSEFESAISQIPKYDDLGQLVDEVTNLKYNRLVDFFSHLKDSYFNFGDQEFEERDLDLLSANTVVRELQLPLVISTSQELWRICKPYEL